MAQGKPSFLYIHSIGFEYYTIGKSPLAFHFIETVVKDLDVLSPGSLKESIKVFIQQNQILPSNLIILLSQTVFFEKDIAGGLPDQAEAQKQEFIDSVPFENSKIKTYPIAQGIKTVVINADITDTIKSAFEENGFVVEAVTPAIVMDGEIVEENGSLSSQSVGNVFNKWNFLKENSFDVKIASIPVAEAPKEEKKQSKKINKELIVLSGVFAFLVIVLIIVILISLKQG